MINIFESEISDSNKLDDAFISIEKKGNKAEVNQRVVSLENHILNDLNISEEVYLIFKSVIGNK